VPKFTFVGAGSPLSVYAFVRADFMSAAEAGVTSFIEFKAPVKSSPVLPEILAIFVEVADKPFFVKSLVALAVLAAAVTFASRSL
jgi:hypothetical protein